MHSLNTEELIERLKPIAIEVTAKAIRDLGADLDGGSLTDLITDNFPYLETQEVHQLILDADLPTFVGERENWLKDFEVERNVRFKSERHARFKSEVSRRNYKEEKEFWRALVTITELATGKTAKVTLVSNASEIDVFHQGKLIDVFGGTIIAKFDWIISLDGKVERTFKEIALEMARAGKLTFA